MNYLWPVSGCVAVFFAAGAGQVLADVQLPAIFGDHMVLQQGVDLPIWGTADAGEKIEVEVAGETGTATADAEGKWRVQLPPLSKGTAPTSMTITGKNVLTFADVLIGEVWLCSGQSNMEFGVTLLPHNDDLIKQANEPQLRFFVVPHTTALTPLTNITEPSSPFPSLRAHWQICTPETIAKDGTWSGFSAVGYFFGREIQKTTGAPVGLIGSYLGGTPAQAWTSLAGLQKDPALQHYVDDYNKIRSDLPQATAELPAKQAAYEAAKAKWDQENGAAASAAYQAWKVASAKALAAGQPAPPLPKPSVPAPQPPSVDGGNPAPANLFNGMIAPLIPYAIKGVIWYQGEANAGQATEYQALFGALITDWREKWGQGDFPFLFVQLAGFKVHGDPNWSFVRESQLDTLALPNTAMASAVDIGDMTSIHPTDKLDVGLRLALAAKHLAYGQDVVYSGPLYDKMTVEGSTIRVSFTQVGSGLVIGTPPSVAPPLTAPTTANLVSFTIAGEDKIWHPADAKIDGNTVIVSSSQVPNPVAVRYAWECLPPINLYNKEGLPASPFRTDDWPPSRVVPGISSTSSPISPTK
jgi:sialate O-acetylesterase